MTARVLVRRATAALTLAFVAACGGDDNTGPSGGSYSIVAPTASITVPAGTGGTTTISLARLGGFTDPVVLSVDNLPAGVTAQFQPTTVLNNQTTADVNFSVAAGTASGDQVITVRGKAAGQPDQTATVKISIISGPSFTATVAATTINLTENDSTKLRTSVVRLGGFAGVVNVSVSGLPAGVTVAFATVANDTASLVFRAASGLTGGRYNVTVNAFNPATGTNIAIPLTINVIEVPGYNLIVTPIPPTPTIAFALPIKGSTLVQSVHAVRRGGYAGAITYTLTGAPPTGVTATFAQNGDDATITYTAAAGILSSTTAMTLTATAPGLTDRTVPIRVAPLDAPLLTSGVAFAIPNGDGTSSFQYAIRVPANASSITFTTTGPTGGPDVDIYARPNQAAINTLSTGGCTSEGATTNETCTITPATAGVYFVRVDGFTPYSGVTLKVTVNP